MPNENDPKKMLCRYFANGCCNKGSECRYSHDRSKKTDNVCQYYLKGSCNYGGSCRYDHVRPKKEQRQNDLSRAGPSRRMPPPPPKTPAWVNLNAPVFRPSTENAKKTPGSYARAVEPTVIKLTEMERLYTTALCPYYESNDVCLNRENCAFVHGDKCDYCQYNSIHPFNAEKSEAHIKQCKEEKEIEVQRAFLLQKSAEMVCGICMENIVEKDLRFGLLENCKHCFCLTCIREWRSKHSTTELDTTVVRSCPECRQHSNYVVPSVVWIETDEEKEVMIKMYKESMKNKICKYYQGGGMGPCPFGKKCFYKHQLPDGSIDPGDSRPKPKLCSFLVQQENDLNAQDINSVLREVRSIMRNMMLSNPPRF